MKILHTADWHIGAKLNGISRKEEQKAVLNEIVDIAEEKDVDIVFVCGDVFHDIISASYADKLLIETLSRLANGGRRAVVALIGNHDDGERLTASKHFAERENIFLVDSINYDYGLEFSDKFQVNLIETGKGYLKFQKGEEVMVVNLMPYPSAWFRKEQFLPKEEFIDKIERLYSCGTHAFEDDTINVSIGHFFVPVSFLKTDMYTEIPKSIIPQAHYTALGHLHTMIAVDEARNIYYSGSPYQIGFNEELTKYVIIAQLSNKGVEEKEFVKIKSHQKLDVIQGKDYFDCKNKLALKQNCFISLNVSEENMSSEEIKKIREEFSNIVSVNILPSIKKSMDLTKKNMNETEVFKTFYKSKCGEKPSTEIVELFKNIFDGGEDETY